MMGLIAQVRRNIKSTCISSSSIKKDGCKVVLTNIPEPRLTIDFDKPGSPLDEGQQRCDYLLVAEVTNKPGWVVPLELKKGAANISKVKDQLQAGAKAAEQIVPSNLEVYFRPVLVCGSIPKLKRTAIKKKSNFVQFRSNSEPIRRIRCDANLADVLKH